ncbi:MAG: heme-dependent oxidative N-demethylase family protein [Anderseniella sp.]
MTGLSPHSALNPDKLPRPFSVGLSALDPVDWILPDIHLADQLRDKAEHFANRREAVFQAEDDTLAAQAETLKLLLDYLPRAHPDIYQVSGDSVTVVPAGMALKISEYDQAPLELACRLVQDDLVIMRKGDAGYRIAAAAVCFPSTWVLADKFSKPISEVHGPVPGFGPGTRTAKLIDRIFDNLKADHPVQRCNWSIYEVPDLHHPFSHSTHTRWSETTGGFFSGTWLRAERQTLTRLPESGDVLFTIQIVVDPVSLLMTHPDRSQIAARLKHHIENLDAAELDYKGISDHRGVVLEELSALAEQGET